LKQVQVNKKSYKCQSLKYSNEPVEIDAGNRVVEDRNVNNTALQKR